MRAQYAECVTTGRCVDCLLDAAPGKRRCEACRLRRNAWNAAYRARKKIGRRPEKRSAAALQPRVELAPLETKHIPIGKVLATIARFDVIEFRDLADVLNVPIDHDDPEYVALSANVARLKRSGAIVVTDTRPYGYYVPKSSAMRATA